MTTLNSRRSDENKLVKLPSRGKRKSATKSKFVRHLLEITSFCVSNRWFCFQKGCKIIVRPTWMWWLACSWRRCSTIRKMSARWKVEIKKCNIWQSEEQGRNRGGNTQGGTVEEQGSAPVAPLFPRCSSLGGTAEEYLRTCSFPGASPPPGDKSVSNVGLSRWVVQASRDRWGQRYKYRSARRKHSHLFSHRNWKR